MRPSSTVRSEDIGKDDPAPDSHLRSMSNGSGNGSSLYRIDGDTSHPTMTLRGSPICVSRPCCDFPTFPDFDMYAGRRLKPLPNLDQIETVTFDEWQSRPKRRQLAYLLP